MARFLHCDLPAWWRKASTIFLALSFTAGLICGISVFYYSGEKMLLLMRNTIYGSVSIVGLICVTFLPFLFSAFAVYISEPRFFLLISFGKAFLFSYISLGISAAFGSAGWLIRWLLMFSDCATLPVLYWFWQNHISGCRIYSGLEVLACFSLCVLIGSIDYSVISPFLAGLIDF